jgi:hypothetical protein
MIDQNYIVKLGSESIIYYVVSKYWNYLKEFLNPTGLYYKSNPLFCGHIFEIVSRVMIQFGGKFDIYKFFLQKEPFTTLNLQKGK